LIKYKQVKTG